MLTDCDSEFESDIRGGCERGACGAGLDGGGVVEFAGDDGEVGVDGVQFVGVADVGGD